MKSELKRIADAQILVMGLFDEDKNVDALKAAKEHLGAELPELGDHKILAQHSQKTLVHGIKKHVLFYGLGKVNELTLNKIRKASSDAAQYCRHHGHKKIAIRCFGDKHKGFLRANVEGTTLGTYTFLKYKTENKETKEIEHVEFLVEDPVRFVGEFSRIVHMCEAINHVRDLGNEPSNVATPRKLAEYAKNLAKKWNLKCTVFDEREIARRNMGALLAVSKGSHEPPRFIILEHKGKKGAEKVCVVGKGITFDSGGISIKPGPAMDEMKFDMCGAGAVLGIMEACARTNVSLNVVGIIPTCENMPSGTAYKPGDIITAMNGKTMEILNTDAEGRVILADGLHYASTLKPKAIFDLATLTGAVIIALGSHTCGVMSNEQKYADLVLEAGRTCGEAAWQLPLWDEYREEVKSDIADIKNLGKERQAGSIAGAAFLEHFVDKTPWVHLDIAGVAWNTAPRAELGKGATGFGVRLLMQVFEEWKR